MTAPTLVILSPGSSQSRVVESMHLLRKRLQIVRPELSVQLAFLTESAPTGAQVAASISGRGVREAVFVPLNLTHAMDAGEPARSMILNIRKAHPQLAISLARPIGPAADLLNVLDLRLRTALSQARVTELDGLVLACPDSGDVRGSALLQRRGRQWSAHHHLPVTLAFADAAGYGVASAIRSLRDQGRRSIAVGSLFLNADDAYLRMVDDALHASAIAVGAPLGEDDRVLDLVMARYSYAAMDLLDVADTEASAAWADPGPGATIIAM